MAPSTTVEGISITTYQSKLKGREEVAEGTMGFHLEKPAGFQFRAGQYIDITLINPPEADSEGAVRTFSIASAPYENEILVATRMRNSTFKRVLATLPLGTEPTGDKRKKGRISLEGEDGE